MNNLEKIQIPNEDELWVAINFILDSYPELTLNDAFEIQIKLQELYKIELSLEAINYFLFIDKIKEYEANYEEIELHNNEYLQSYFQ